MHNSYQYRDGEFYVEDLPPGTYEATIDSRESVCRFRLTVPAGSAAVVDLGSIVCTQPGS